jgi:PhzF family phenazine biosynthesis protein
MQQPAPGYIPLDAQTIQEALRSLGITSSSLLPGCEPMVVNTGNSFLLIPLRDEAALKSLVPDAAPMEAVSEKLDLVGYYPFTLQTQVQGRDAAARMFAPRYGIQEESATGMAAGPLACFLHDRLHIRKERLVLEQGRLMPSPSPGEILVELKLEDGRIAGLLAGGRARLIRTMQVGVD